MSLLYSILNHKDHKSLFAIPDGFYSEDYKPVISFVQKYYLEHKEFPTTQALEAKFELEISGTDEPVSFFFEDAQRRFRKEVILEAAKAGVQENSIKPFEDAILKFHAGEESGVKSYGETIPELLKRYEKEDNEKGGRLNKIRQLYIIFLQDNQILKAIQRDRKVKLLPLLAYIITHELVHIVRFCKFQVMFETQQKEKRIREEEIVHETTNEILSGLSLPNLPYILGSYKPDKINMDVCV